MELRHLTYFLALADLRHFGRAAAAVGIRQPPFSQQIKQLEEELCVRLVDRGPRGSELTAAGEVFADHARAVLDAVERSRLETRRVARGEVGKIEIAALTSSFATVLPRVLRALRGKHPEVVAHPVEYQRTADAVQAVLDGVADVAFGRPPLSTVQGPGTLLAMPLGMEQAVVIMARDHALAGEKSVPIAALRNQKFILTPLEERFPQYFHLACAAAGFQPELAARVQGVQAVVGMVAAGQGVAVIPESAVLPGRLDVVFRPIAPAVVAPPLCLIWLARDTAATTTMFSELVRHSLKLTGTPLSEHDLDRGYLVGIQAGRGSS
ncbi:LysR family transcriptional regulator [Amycolatopsis sp. NPDC059027]|uniref:LysR family transcriptional regulator n=1 Tax=unclassified Amycolatopsis TaxID=2618356 RepID=UPI0036728CD1